jgi:hypothetical protein
MLERLRKVLVNRFCRRNCSRLAVCAGHSSFCICIQLAGCKLADKAGVARSGGSCPYGLFASRRTPGIDQVYFTAAGRVLPAALAVLQVVGT